jgi:hypothetical protein
LEHTLVKQGGRDSSDAKVGNIAIIDFDQKYLVRLDNTNNFINSDLIIDYSNCNIKNVESLYPDIATKMIYISPAWFPFYKHNIYRPINIATTFLNSGQPRRDELKQKLQSYFGDNYQNITGFFTQDDTRSAMLSCKILINIHQTPHHNTFEELRVLPAILCGVIVISEKSPLSHLVPYSKFVIWAGYEEIINTCKNVLQNYDEYHTKIFSNIQELDMLHNKNKIKIASIT